MFSPKEEFQTIELFVDHIAARIKEKFTSTESDVFNRMDVLRGYVEDELSSARVRLEQFEQRIRAIEANTADRFTTVFERIGKVERAINQPTPVNAPPSPEINLASGESFRTGIQVQSQVNSEENSQASTATASE